MMQKGHESLAFNIDVDGENPSTTASPTSTYSSQWCYNTKEWNKEKIGFILLFGGPIAKELNCVSWKDKFQMRHLHENMKQIEKNPIKCLH